MRSSFDTTIDVLDGLLEFERATGDRPRWARPAAAARSICSSAVCSARKSTGEVDDPGICRLRLPVLLALRRPARPRLLPAGRGAEPDPRMAEAVEIVGSKRQPTGRWLLYRLHPRRVHTRGRGIGAPSRWLPSAPPGARLVGPRGCGEYASSSWWALSGWKPPPRIPARPKRADRKEDANPLIYSANQGRAVLTRSRHYRPDE